ncbi:hypothetical protein ACWGCI_37750 [Streptomyces sp. NPDC054949]|uniref:hypothetical protein n=1 Tax=Streptomyces sp. NPDC001553 TaxID=3154385 RepID=UPI00331E652B
MSHIYHLVIAVVVAAWTFAYRLVSWGVLALQMAVLSARRRTALRNGPLHTVASGGIWRASSTENY